MTVTAVQCGAAIKHWSTQHHSLRFSLLSAQCGAADGVSHAQTAIERLRSGTVSMQTSVIVPRPRSAAAAAADNRQKRAPCYATEFSA